MSDSPDLDGLAVNTIRGLAMDAVQAASSGHPGTPMALAPLGWALFSSLRRHDPAHPEWPDRDRFVLSCGHASMLQYSLLHLAGYDVPLEQLRQFRQWGSMTPGHPEAHETPGVETTTGPLGQGFGNAVGMAMAERHLAARFNRPGHTLFDHRTWVLASDGDIMEGVASEAASLAGHLRLGKLVVFWDDNHITIDGRTDLSFSEDALARFAAYGWHVQSLDDGNDMDALRAAGEAAKADPRPSFVRVRTIIGYPAPNRQDTAAAHGAPLGADEVAATKAAMGWREEPFYVPEALTQARDDIRRRGKDLFSSWEEKVARYKAEFPEDGAALEATLAGRLPEGWDGRLPRFDPDAKGLATRKASGKALAALAEAVPQLVGGSADLAGSNGVSFGDAAAFESAEAKSADARSAQPAAVPRVVHWGVREHAMGSAVNGMALHGGVVPLAATFLIFSDYMRPALRLAALMKIPTRYVFSHDSIGLGEDGPTHQPVEQLSSLRAIPDFTVLRPADANEAVECWKVALERPGPAALVLTRQNVPILDRAHYGGAEGARRGAYVLSEANGEARALVIGTGSEVHVALEGQRLLQDRGIPTRVVSMPSWELFAEQDESYREAVLPEAIGARVAVEAGVRHGWERWVGRSGGFVTLDRFGASAPYETLYRELGITAERVAEEVQRALERPER